MSVCIVLGCIQTLNTTVAAAYGLLWLCSDYMLAKCISILILQGHLMLSNMCVHLLLHMGS